MHKQRKKDSTGSMGDVPTEKISEMFRVLDGEGLSRDFSGMTCVEVKEEGLVFHEKIGSSKGTLYLSDVMSPEEIYRPLSDVSGRDLLVVAGGAGMYGFAGVYRNASSATILDADPYALEVGRRASMFMDGVREDVETGGDDSMAKTRLDPGKIDELMDGSEGEPDERMRFVLGDMTRMKQAGLRENEFDTALMVYALNEPKDPVKAVLDTVNVVKPGGEVLVYPPVFTIDFMPLPGMFTEILKAANKSLEESGSDKKIGIPFEAGHTTDPLALGVYRKQSV